MKKFFTEEVRDGKHFVFDSFDRGGACIGVGITRKKAFEMAFNATMNNIHGLTLLKDQLAIAAGKKKRRCRAKGD